MLVLNNNPDYRQPLTAHDTDLLGPASADGAAQFFSHHPDYRPTPLRSLPTLAQDVGIGAIHVKDESERLGLDSFKALGGMFAAARLVLEEASRVLGRHQGPGQLASAPVRKVAAGMVLACATDGNHGRAVAAGAQLAGAAARIFVHEGVSTARRAAIERFGATVIVVPGSYDDAVAAASRACGEHGWHGVSDTAWPGHERVPGYVMQGYTLLAREALGQLQDAPTHVFIQAGVGGLAAAIAGYHAVHYGDARPRFVVVEPARAACLLGSLHAGRPIRIAQGEPTMMAMLECHTPSVLAWRILTRAADAFMTVDEGDALAIMRRLARPRGADPVLVAGESGGVGLAGLLRVAGDARLRASLGLTATSRVLLVNTEGATDPVRYKALVNEEGTT